MIEFSNWKSVYLENQDLEVSGPGIKALINGINYMASLSPDGASEINNVGFNKNDVDTYLRIRSFIHGDTVSLKLVPTMLGILVKYKNRQFRDYDNVKRMVDEDLKKYKTTPNINSEGSIYVYKNRDNYGKYKVYIPGGVDLSDKRGINKIIDASFEKEGASKEYDNYGNQGYPRWKKFNQSKDAVDTFLIHGSVLDEILGYLKAKKGKEVEYESGSSLDVTDDSSKGNVLGAEIVNTNFGPRVAISIPYNTYMKLKAIGSPDPISFDYNSKRVLINFSKNDGYERAKEILKANDFDVSEIERKVKEYVPVHSESPDVSKSIQFIDGGTNKLRIKVSYFDLTPEKKEFLKEVIQYTFPGYNFENYTYNVEGNYKQYISFNHILKRFKYDVSELENIIHQKVANNGLERTKYEGQHDHDEEFKKDIEKRLPNSKFDLYDAQKDGIAYLYGRNHMVLGDETGFGKCISKDSRVQTNLGVFTMSELWEKFATNISYADGGEWADCMEDLFVHSMNEQEKIVKKQVIKLYRQKVNTQMKEIFTSNGKKIAATLPHKFYTLDGWKSEITTNDYICSSANQFSLQTNDFNDFELTKLLAWQISEGYENKKASRVKIYQNDKSVLLELKKIYDKMQVENKIPHEASKAILEKSKKNKVRQLSITSRNYRDYLEKMGYKWGLKSAQKQIPQFIMQANNDVVKAFLRSYFDAEGYVNPNCRQIEISSASKTMIYQLSTLLQRFNILCSFSESIKMATNGKRIKRKYYRLYVCGNGVDNFFKDIGLDYEYKNKNYYELKTKSNSNKNGKPLFKLLSPFFEKYNLAYRIFDVPSKNYIKGKRWASNKIIEKVVKKFKELESGLLFEEYKKLKKSKWTDKAASIFESIDCKDVENLIADLERLLNNDLQYEKVISSEKINYDDYVYDLSIDETHNYIAENIICHNTIQLVSAAELKMQENKKPTLIVTLKAVQKQWVDTIADVVGDQERSNISVDGLNPKKWTVLYYENFSSGKNLQKVLETLKNNDFGIVVFDELHKLKHGDTKRTKNLESVIEKIPIRWGATATISSNKPMDVRQQLIMTGHHLGKMKESKFKYDFVGGDDKSSEGQENQIKAAEKLNRWLNLSGVYKRRSKSDIREMPNISIHSRDIVLDQNRFNEFYAKRIENYKKRDGDVIPISRLIAARETISHLKTTETAKRVAKIVANNLEKEPAASKVVVFTNFAEAGDQLISKIKMLLEHVDEGFYVLDYLSNTKKSERAKVKEKFTNDPNAKVLVMSMKMGGTGIDFPNAAQNMVVNDFDWTPESAEQSEGRIYRINTNHPVNIQYIVSDGLDRELYDVVQRKRKLAEIIQRHRAEYHEKENDKEALNKIVDAQKQMLQLNKDMVAIANKTLPGVGDALQNESFVDKMNNRKEIEKYLFGG
jgi:intein/homing endonuclease/superfamily II DNA or RNA helicase